MCDANLHRKKQIMFLPKSLPKKTKKTRVNHHNPFFGKPVGFRIARPATHAEKMPPSPMSQPWVRPFAQMILFDVPQANCVETWRGWPSGKVKVMGYLMVYDIKGIFQWEYHSCPSIDILGICKMWQYIYIYIYIWGYNGRVTVDVRCGEIPAMFNNP